VKKGFRNINHKEFAVINVGVLEEKFKEGEVVTLEALVKQGLIGNTKDGLKILGFGDLKKKLKVSANAFSKAAEEKIKSAGGEVTRL
jgi:large subunit ribosomal protein L15